MVVDGFMWFFVVKASCGRVPCNDPSERLVIWFYTEGLLLYYQLTRLRDSNLSKKDILAQVRSVQTRQTYNFSPKQLPREQEEGKLCFGFGILMIVGYGD